jgi:hypothetical protein
MLMKNLIKKILEHTGYTAYRLGIEASISRQMVHKWLHQDVSSVRVDHLVRLKRASGLSWSRIGEILERHVDSDSE